MSRSPGLDPRGRSPGVVPVPAVARARAPMRGRPGARATDGRRRRRARRGGGGGRGRSSRGTRPGRAASSVAASSHTERPARTPLAPARAGDLDLGLERRVVDAAREQHPRHRDAASSSSHASRQRAGSTTDASYGNSALRMSPPIAVSRRAVSMTTSRRASPVSFSPSTSENESGSTNSARSTRAAGGRDVADEPLLVRRVRRLRVVVDEELRRRRAHALRLLDAPALEDAADPRRRGTRVAGRLDRDDEPGRGGQRPIGDALGRADLGVQQRAGRDRGEGPDDRPLERDHLVVRHRRRVVRAERLAQVLAVVEGEDGERAARGRAGVEPAPRAEPVGVGGRGHDGASRRIRRALSR